MRSWPNSGGLVAEVVDADTVREHALSKAETGGRSDSRLCAATKIRCARA